MGEEQNNRPNEDSIALRALAEISEVRTRLDRIAEVVHTMAGKQGLVNKIVWVIFALLLTVSATSAIDAFVNILMRISK